MKAKTNVLLIVVALLAYWAGLCNASAFYDPGQQRWLNRDPIMERGFYYTVHPEFEYLHGWVMDYTFVGNIPIDRIDAVGLWHICCRLIRYKEGEGCKVAFGSYFIHHCDARPSSQPCDNPSDPSYPILKDPDSSGKLPDGTPCCKATQSQVHACLSKHPTTPGHGVWGDNCQSTTVDNLKTCCGKSNWPPSPYAFPLEPYEEGQPYYGYN